MLFEKRWFGITHINCNIPVYVRACMCMCMYACMHVRTLLSFQAETSSLFIPELEFELHSGTLGGRFTTVEGLLRNALDQLKESNPLGYGDSATYSKLHNFIDRLAEVKNIACTMITQ